MLFSKCHKIITTHPPINITAPGTNPPPNILLNSVLFKLILLIEFKDVILSIGVGLLKDVTSKVEVFLKIEEEDLWDIISSSVMVFQIPHSVHLPIHFK